MKKLIIYTILLVCFSNFSIAQPNSYEIWENDTVNRIDSEGLKQGLWLAFHESGIVQKRTFYQDGIPHGGESGFYKNGKIRHTIIWNHGVPHGFYQIYYSSGFVKKSGVWVNDKNIGALVEYFETGTVKKRSTFNSKGELEGAIVGYHGNERISSVELYEQGLKNGFTLAFDSTGTLLTADKYVKDQLIDYEPDSDELRGVLDYVTEQNRLVFVRDSLRQAQAELQIAEVESKAKIEKQNQDLAQEAQRRYFLYGGLVLLLIFGIFMYNRFRVTRKQKGIIEAQKLEVDKQKETIEETHKEITDSIAYAKRIQSAILPPNSLIAEHLPNSFVLYKPKDVVAGDFYWLEYKDGKTIFAAADCTGHGVPGAMVSVICNNALNRSVREFGYVEPNEILNKARELVVQEFEKSEEEVKDGMDIALCSLKGKTLHYAGANNPLWIVRNGEIIETKADKEPIGKFENSSGFTNHTFELEANDSFYIFSNGYVDQFGGDKGKKFKTKALRELLLSIRDHSMSDQKDLIDKAFEDWRGPLEQIDDVCFIGVRV